MDSQTASHFCAGALRHYRTKMHSVCEPLNLALAQQGIEMSYFVTVTFDLNYASMSPEGLNVYSKIKNDLDNLDYSKVVNGKKKIDLKLPSNTFVAEFVDDGEHQSEISDFVKDELIKIFKSYSVKGKYFISVGKNWSWKIGTF